MSATPERPGGCGIAVLASRVGADEKRLFDAFDRRGGRAHRVDVANRIVGHPVDRVQR
ncbi:hypothetical protein ACWKT3_34215 [Streptomyces violaceus]